MTKLAPKFGLPDVGLAKVCRRYDIPRPHVGYWAQVTHGIEVERAELPAVEDPDLQEVRIFKRQFFNEPKNQPGRKRVEVTVPDELESPHPISRNVRRELRATKQDDHGIKSVGSKSGFDVSVGNKSIPRAVRIIDAAIKAWINEGGRVENSAFSLGSNSVQVSLKERVARHEIKNKEHRYWKEYRYALTGMLSLEIDGWACDGIRKTWKDGKVQRLEKALGSFIETLHQWMKSLELRRLDNECEARQRRAAQSHRESRLAKEKAEKERREELHGFAERWDKAERIRGFLHALSKRDSMGPPPDPESDYVKWVEWAHWYADCLCPLTTAPPRKEFAEEPENRRVSELDLTRGTESILGGTSILNTNQLFSMDQNELAEACGRDHIYSLWSEVNLVLGGLGYDVRDRSWGTTKFGR